MVDPFAATGRWHVFGELPVCCKESQQWPGYTNSSCHTLSGGKNYLMFQYMLSGSVRLNAEQV